MKKLTLLVIFFTFSCLNAFAHLAEIGGVFYRFLGTEAIVTYKSYECGNDDGGTDMEGPEEFDNEYSGKIIIPQSVKYKGRTYRVTTIDDCAFYECSGVTSVTLPSTITYIGNGAFSGCAKLSNIIVGNAVNFVGWGILDGTKWYKRQPNGILYLGNYCIGYKGTAPIGAITIKTGTRVIACQALSGSKITSVKIPKSTVSVCVYAFNYCEDLKTVTINNPNVNIEECAFSGCTILKSFKIGTRSLSQSKIQKLIFSSCPG